MNLFQPKHWPHELLDPIDLEHVRVITRWPNQKLCARIERKRMDEVLVNEEQIL